MALGVHSEVGTLRRVMVHRPGLEHTRLTPGNAEELLFDDVIWVSKAKQEHDAFCEAMREREVGIGASRRAVEWIDTADHADAANFLIGGITKADVERDLGLVWESADP